MTTPLGVPNLPIGALTVETLGDILQDMSAAAMRQRAGERFPDIFNLTTGGDVLNDLTPFGILTSIWAQFNSILANADPEDVQGPEDIPDLILGFIEEIPLIGILVKFVEALGFDAEAVEDFLQPIFDFLNWLWDLVGQEAETILKPVFEFLNWLFTEYGDEVTTFLQPTVEFFNELFTQFGGVSNWFFKFVESIAGNLPTTAQEVIDTLTELALRIPILGGLVAQLTGKTPVDGVALDLSTIGVWAGETRKKLDELEDKFQQVIDRLTGKIPISQVNVFDQNLLSQGDFLTESTVVAADNWSWDSTQNRTGSGGSAKVTCTGSLQRLYSTQSIQVAAGDKISASAWVKTSGFTSGSITIALIPWVGTSRLQSGGANVTEQLGSARTTAATNWASLPGGTYTVPAGVTSVQLRVGVNCNVGCIVNFDDVKLTKGTDLLGQGLVNELIPSWQNIYDQIKDAPVIGPIWYAVGQALGEVGTSAGNAEETAAGINLTLFGDEEGNATGVIDKEAIPVTEIGKDINPGVGSGAVMSRTDTTPISASGGRNGFSVHSGFFGNGSSTSDIGANKTTATFTVNNAGWYLAEISFRLGTAGTTGFNAAPLLYKNGSPFKIGSDGIQTATRTSRYSQSSFIVYLAANETVSAGYDVDATTGTPQFIADNTGIETYFSLSLLNKSFA